jgi:hypothetical protein
VKLFSFPVATLEKAISKRIMTLSPEHKEWFMARWQQKPYKKSFLDNKALPLVTIVSKCKSMSDEDFDQVMAEWDAKFYEAEAQVLRPMVQGDGLLQLMQKNLPEARVLAILNKLDTDRV